MKDCVFFICFLRIKRLEKDSVFPEKSTGIFFRVDSVDKVDTGKTVRKKMFASCCNTIYYLSL